MSGKIDQRFQRIKEAIECEFPGSGVTDMQLIEDKDIHGWRIDPRDWLEPVMGVRKFRITIEAVWAPGAVGDVLEGEVVRCAQRQRLIHD